MSFSSLQSSSLQSSSVDNFLLCGTQCHRSARAGMINWQGRRLRVELNYPALSVAYLENDNGQIANRHEFIDTPIVYRTGDVQTRVVSIGFFDGDSGRRVMPSNELVNSLGVLVFSVDRSGEDINGVKSRGESGTRTLEDGEIHLFKNSFSIENSARSRLFPVDFLSVFLRTTDDVYDLGLFL